MQHIRIGVPDVVSIQPLIYGLKRHSARDCVLSFGDPGFLVDALSWGKLDAALLPSIEYFRGAGKYFVDDPMLIARTGLGNSVLLASTPAESVQRIAVDECSRSSVGITRIVLAEKYGVTPDLCVYKNIQGDWREEHDGRLLTGDRGLDYLVERSDRDVRVYNVTAMWDELTSLPLVSALWVYNDERLESRLVTLLARSRDEGVENLSVLANEISVSHIGDRGLIRDYLDHCWQYYLNEKAMEGLKILEDYALRYDLIRYSRLAEITAK